MSVIAPPTLPDVHAAASRLTGIIVRSPLVPLRATHGGEPILLKLESLQPAGSFKVRGVFNAVASMSPSRRDAGIATLSAGNTAKALAWCGRHYGVPARSIMPDTAPPAKIDAVTALGGETVLMPREAMFEYFRNRGWEDEPHAFVHPWFDRDVHAGHATMALEIIDDLHPDTVFVPVGGGGLMTGIGPTIGALSPQTRVIAVEPTGCPALHASFAAGHPTSVTCATICDGVAVPYITEELFPTLREVVDEVVLVEEDAVRDTIRLLIDANHVIAEPSAALAVAAALATPPDHRGRAVCIVSGGGIDRRLLRSLLDDAA